MRGAQVSVTPVGQLTPVQEQLLSVVPLHQVGCSLSEVSSAGQPHVSEQLQLTMSPEEGVVKKKPHSIGNTNHKRVRSFISNPFLRVLSG